LTKRQAVFELIFAGALWGFGFVATAWSLKSFTPAEVLCYRFILALAAGELIYLLIHWRRPHWPEKSDVIYSLLGGLFLGGLLILQTIGLQYTTATNSGFITTLYVILVPVLSHLFFKHEVNFKLYLYVLLALFGTVLLVGITPSAINKGDLWTLACSFVAAIHIIYIGKVSGKIKNSFRFNNLQSLWCFVLLLPLLLRQNHIQTHAESFRPWFGILFLAIGSSTLGFYIQVRTQKVLSSTTASMLFLLESPYAFLFGFLFLGETLNAKQFLGAFLIILASYLTIRWEQTSQTK
jgi:drug/metabolite transporter (DMT)-like permease